MERYNFNSTNVADFPLVSTKPLTRACLLDQLALERMSHVPTHVVAGAPPSRQLLDEAKKTSAHLISRMITVQEELDWEVYREYGIIDDDLTYSGDDLPHLNLGQSI